MLILKIAAFWLPMIGIGGIVGAVETGTSPVNAVITFIIGCLVMLLYIKLDNAMSWRDKAGRKEATMSGFEREELISRVKGMTPDEQRVVAENLPYEMLWEELHRRNAIQNTTLKIIETAVCGFTSLPDHNMKTGSATVESYRT